MSDDLCLPIKDVLAVKPPKSSSLVLRMVVLAFSMTCGVFIFSVCFKQFSSGINTGFADVRVVNKPCEAPDVEPWEKPYVHYPKPTTFSRAECACNPVRFFAILSTQRSGSGWFETLLNSHMNISSNGEIFSVKPRRSNISTIVETLDKVYNLDFLTSASKNECTAAVGLKWMLNQGADGNCVFGPLRASNISPGPTEMLDHLVYRILLLIFVYGLLQHHEEILEHFQTRGVSIIFLFRRNLLRRMISILANSYDQNAKLLNGTHKSHVHSPQDADILARYKPTINTTLLISDLKQVEDMVSKGLEYFKSTRHILLYYEDIIINRTKLNDVQDFLRVPRMNLMSRQVKIHKGSLDQQVENWDDIRKTLNGTSYESFLNADYRV